MKRNRAAVRAISFLATLALSFAGFAGYANGTLSTALATAAPAVLDFAGGTGSAEDPWQIATAEQLSAIRHSLDGHYVLIGDVDLSTLGEWTPIGTYVPTSEEEPDVPDPLLAFTGTLDGGGHKISGMNIHMPDASSVGLFGCVAGEQASVSNLIMEDFTVVGYNLVGGVIGYAGFPNNVENVSLIGQNTITGGAMTGGIVGGGFCGLKGCSSAVDILYVETNENSGGGAGILSGGMESGIIEDCSATGSITSTVNGGFFGGLVACAFGSPSIANCEVDATIVIGENAKMVGGLVGHAGSFDAANPTVITSCTVKAEITAPERAERIGGIVGSGFYDSEMVPSPAIFKVIDCHTSGSIQGGAIVGTIAGYTYMDSTVESCTSDMAVNGEQDHSQVGATLDDIALDQLR